MDLKVFAHLKHNYGRTYISQAEHWKPQLIHFDYYPPTPLPHLSFGSYLWFSTV